MNEAFNNQIDKNNLASHQPLQFWHNGQMNELATNAEMKAIYEINNTVSHSPRSVYCYLWISKLLTTKTSLSPYYVMILWGN